MKETVILVDAKNLAYRMYYAHSTLKTKAGRKSGLIYGFLKDVLRLHKEFSASMVFCWDGKAPTWRHRVCPYYKANRNTPAVDQEEMIGQLDVVFELLKQLNFRNPRIHGVEADDLIGMLTVGLREKYNVKIYSNDRDMYQLIGPGVVVFSRRKAGDHFVADVVGRKEAEAWLGAPLEALPEIKAMRGDPADNLKGLPGIGPKKAVQLWAAGCRISDKSSAAGLLNWGIEREDWIRVRQEYELAKMVTDPESPLWTKEQRSELCDTIPKILACPGRREKTSDRMRAYFYRVTGEYELEEVFKERASFWDMQ